MYTCWTVIALLSQAMAGEVVQWDPSRVTIATEAQVAPSEVVAVYVVEPRPDPRNQQLVDGLRYTGDARVLWVADGLVDLRVDPRSDPLRPGSQVELGTGRGEAPVAAWEPPEPADEPLPVDLPAPTVVAAESPTPSRPEDRLHLPAVAPHQQAHDQRWAGRRQSIRLDADFASYAFGTELGSSRVSWRWIPDGPVGLVDIGLDVVRGRAWSVSGGERGQEPAVAYGLWTRLDSSGASVAAIVGLGLGVDEQGVSAGGEIGGRLGQPTGERVELIYRSQGDLGGRLSVDGRLEVRPGLRLGLRARVGDLPRNDGARLLQSRADGTALLELDLAQRHSLGLGAGVGAYDLLLADFGPVLHGSWESRW